MKEPYEMRPGNPYWKSPAKSRTLRDLAVAKLALVAVCQRCRYRSLLFPYELDEKLGRTSLWIRFRPGAAAPNAKHSDG